MLTKGLRGFLIDSPRAGVVRSVRDGAILIQDGYIVAVGSYADVSEAPEAAGVCWMHSAESVIMPGLIDLHSHLPQYPAAGRSSDCLASWNECIVFPLEREFNAGTARKLAPRFYEALARNGTTCATLHAAVYEESCDEAFAAAAASGMRVILGKVMMDACSIPASPKDRTTEGSLAQSERLCRKWHGHDQGRLHYAFSPRSVGNCSREMLVEIGMLAKKYDAFVQVHLSETRDEGLAVRERFPEFDSEIEVLEDLGLLTDRTILASGDGDTARQLSRLAKRRSVIAHCPTSDLFLKRGIMPFDMFCDAGLRLGFGSDVGAGHDLDLWRVMRSAIESQQARSFYANGVRLPAVGEIFYLATQGAADALGFGGRIGSLDIGKEADLIVLNPLLCMPLPKFERYPLANLSAEELLALFIYRGGSHALVETFVRGKSVYRAPEPLLL